MTEKIPVKDLMQPTHKNTWCPGCGNFGILASVQKAIVESGFSPKDTVMVSGIGCSGKIPHYIKTYGFESVHGRALPVATGVKLANPKLNVIAAGGDGDGYGIGSAHFLHTARRNINLTYIVHDNHIYALTKGQYSPTTETGHKTPTSPHGAIEMQLNPLVVAIVAGATFVARSYANDIAHLSGLITKAIAHHGFAIIDVIQPCITWRKDRLHPKLKELIYSPENLNTSDKTEAIKFLLEEEKNDKIAIGLFYLENKHSYGDDLTLSDKETPIVKQDITNIDVKPLLNALE